MSVTYDPVARLIALKLPLLAQAFADNNETTLHIKGAGTFCIYRPKLCINVSEAGQVLIGEPMGRQLVVDPSRIRESFGVAQLPSQRGIAWERLREDL